MNPLYDLLKKMRHRPALYNGSDSIIKLASFLRGFTYALEHHCSVDTHRFLAEFREWVAKRFSVTISQSWENIILFHSTDDREAMKLFWTLLDEYLAECEQREKKEDKGNGDKENGTEEKRGQRE
jgi:hypothetical protein